MTNRFAVISSTAASVVKAVFANTSREVFNLDLIIVDRECGAKEFGIKNNIQTRMVSGANKNTFSDEILLTLEREKIDYVYLFFTRILKGDLLKIYYERIINFHPSLLPACPGLNGFEDTIKSGAMLVGSTVHFVDTGIDTGEIILQGYASSHSMRSIQLRHVIFAQQCASLYEIHKKLKNDMPLLDVTSRTSELSQGFLPNLDADSLSLYNTILNKE